MGCQMRARVVVVAVVVVMADGTKIGDDSSQNAHLIRNILCLWLLTIDTFSLRVGELSFVFLVGELSFVFLVDEVFPFFLLKIICCFLFSCSLLCWQTVSFLSFMTCPLLFIC